MYIWELLKLFPSSLLKTLVQILEQYITTVSCGHMKSEVWSVQVTRDHETIVNWLHSRISTKTIANVDMGEMLLES